MAKTIRTGAYLAASGLAGGISNPVHSAPGRLLALLISHTQAGNQSVTVYDALTAVGGTQIAVIDVAPSEAPFYIEFNREQGIPFSTGLYISNGNCNVLVWSVDHG